MQRIPLTECILGLERILLELQGYYDNHLTSVDTTDMSNTLTLYTTNISTQISKVQLIVNKLEGWKRFRNDEDVKKHSNIYKAYNSFCHTCPMSVVSHYSIEREKNTHRSDNDKSLETSINMYLINGMREKVTAMIIYLDDLVEFMKSEGKYIAKFNS